MLDEEFLELDMKIPHILRAGQSLLAKVRRKQLKVHTINEQTKNTTREDRHYTLSSRSHSS